MIFKRFIHLSPSLSFQFTQIFGNQSNLSKLRKSTGYALSLCKNALEKNNNDVEKAVKWLDEQAQVHGWNKAEKLKDRSTSQGLLGFLKTSKHATIVEVRF
jgi:elongation factor Ts